MIDIEAVSSHIQDLCKDRTDYPLIIDLEKDMHFSMGEFFFLRESLKEVGLILTTNIDSWAVKVLEVNK